MKKIRLENANIKLVVYDETYYTNKNNTTCVIKYYMKMPELLGELIGSVSGEVKATTCCLEGDTYDKKTGEKIALAKASSKAYAQASGRIQKRISSLTRRILTVVPAVDRFTEKTIKVIEHNGQYVEKIF